MTSSTAEKISIKGSDTPFSEIRRKVLLKREFITEQALAPNPAPLVSVVVLNFNGALFINDCIEALLAQSYPNFHIVVVDNASTDSSRDIIRSYTGQPNSRVTSVLLDNNLGVAGGRNAAIEHCKGSYIAFIDNDGFADQKWLENSINHLDANPEVGALASLVFFKQKETLLNGAGGERDERGYACDSQFSSPIEYASLSKETLYPMGCGMVLSKSAIDDCFPLDGVLPKWFDDVEIGERLWRAGYKVEICKGAHVVHGFHGSDSSLSPPGWKRALLFEKARYRHLLKYPARGSLLYSISKEFSALFSKLFSEPKLLPVCGLAILWNLLNLHNLPKKIGSGSNNQAAFSRYKRESVFSNLSPSNHLLHNDFANMLRFIDFSNEKASNQLHYGWHELESESNVSFRKIGKRSSSFFQLGSNTCKLLINLRARQSAIELGVEIRELGSIKSTHRSSHVISSDNWQQLEIELEPISGKIELQLSHDLIAENSLEMARIEFCNGAD